MTRDNELIRQIILAIKARKDTTPQALKLMVLTNLLWRGTLKCADRLPYPIPR